MRTFSAYEGRMKIKRQISLATTKKEDFLASALFLHALSLSRT